MKVAILTPDLSAIESIKTNINQQELAVMQAHPSKGPRTLPIVNDVLPVPTNLQNIIDGPLVIQVPQARVLQTWALENKSAEQIEYEDIQAEKAQINSYLTDLQTQLDISNAARAALTNNQRINELEKDTRVLMKSMKFLLRATKRSL
jgi:hypothetical protein